MPQTGDQLIEAHNRPNEQPCYWRASQEHRYLIGRLQGLVVDAVPEEQLTKRFDADTRPTARRILDREELSTCAAGFLAGFSVSAVVMLAALAGIELYLSVGVAP